MYLHEQAEATAAKLKQLERQDSLLKRKHLVDVFCQKPCFVPKHAYCCLVSCLNLFVRPMLLIKPSTAERDQRRRAEKNVVYSGG